MIREFLKCCNTTERVKFLTDSTISDWSENDLDTVLNTMGIPSVGLADKAAKLTAIGKHLAAFRHEVEEKSEMDCSRLDQETYTDAGETLFEPGSVSKTVNAVLGQYDK